MEFLFFVCFFLRVFCVGNCGDGDPLRFVRDGEESSNYNMELVVLLVMEVCLTSMITHTHSQSNNSKSLYT